MKNIIYKVRNQIEYQTDTQLFDQVNIPTQFQIQNRIWRQIYWQIYWQLKIQIKNELKRLNHEKH
jgi:hypothetical protein